MYNAFICPFIFTIYTVIFEIYFLLNKEFGEILREAYKKKGLRVFFPQKSKQNKTNTIYLLTTLDHLSGFVVSTMIGTDQMGKAE